MINFVFPHFFIVLLAAFSCFVVGFLVLSKFPFNDKLENVFFSTTLGLGIWALVTFFLGIFGLLYKESIYVIDIAVVVIVLKRRGIKPLSLSIKFFLRDHIKDILIITGLLVIVYPVLIMYLYPPTSWDATSYHLAISRIWSNGHKLVLTPYVRYPVFNQLTEQLFTAMLLLKDDISAQSISLISNILIILGIYTFSLRFFNRSIGILSVAFWLSSPLIGFLSSTGYIDINLTLYALAAIYSGFIFIFEGYQKKWLYLSSFFFGLAIGAKYSSLILVLIWILLISGFLLRDKKKVLDIVKIDTVLSAIAILTSAIWFIRNFYYTGNPVFPFFFNLFGGGNIWNAQDYYMQIKDLLNNNATAFEKTFSNFMILPYRLSFSPHMFHLEAPFSPYFALGILLLVTHIKKVNKYIFSLIVISTIYGLTWFLSTPIPRYLIIVWPLMCLTFGWALGCLIFKLLKRHVIVSRIFVLVIALLILLPVDYKYYLPSFKQMGNIPVTNEERDWYITNKLPTYPAYNVLNNKPPGVLYAMHDENMNYFYHGTFIGDWFGPGRYSFIEENMKDGQKLYNALATFKTDYFLVHKPNSKEYAQLPKDNFFSQHFKLIYTDPYVDLYEIIKS